MALPHIRESFNLNAHATDDHCIKCISDIKLKSS